MDLVLKMAGGIFLILALIGELQAENLIILSIGGFFLTKHLEIYSGAPVY